MVLGAVLAIASIGKNSLSRRPCSAASRLCARVREAVCGADFVWALESPALCRWPEGGGGRRPLSSYCFALVFDDLARDFARASSARGGAG